MQHHFEFKDWEQAFETFYRRRLGYEIKEGDRVLGFREGDPNLVFVISTACYVSGYWIERSETAIPDSETQVYRTVEEVRELEQRIRSKRNSTVNLSLGGVVV